MVMFLCLENIAITYLFYLEYSSPNSHQVHNLCALSLLLYSTLVNTFMVGSLLLGKIKSVALQKIVIGFEECSIKFLSFLRLI